MNNYQQEILNEKKIEKEKKRKFTSTSTRRFT
jgi:hypothetical protein